MSDRLYLINRELQSYVELTKNDHYHNKDWIRTVPNGEYYMTDWRTIEEGFATKNTFFGSYGEELLKWMYDHEYKNMTKEEEVFFELAR